MAHNQAEFFKDYLATCLCYPMKKGNASLIGMLNIMKKPGLKT